MEMWKFNSFIQRAIVNYTLFHIDLVTKLPIEKKCLSKSSG